MQLVFIPNYTCCYTLLVIYLFCNKLSEIFYYLYNEIYK